jgi:beta-glucosidase
MSGPEGFAWGTGWSAVDADGPAPASDVAAWRGPSAPGTGEGAGFATHHRNQLAALAGSGLRSLRLTLDWARIEPANGTFDTAALVHVDTVLDAAAELGVDVWACLHDGSLPGWFAHDERGFGDARTRRYLWPRHVDRMAERFGDRVAGWVPVYEPSRWAVLGWLDGAGPPGRRDDAEGFARHLEAAHLATVEAALRLRGGGRPVASAQWLVPVFPARLDPRGPLPAESEAAAAIVDEALRGCWLRMLAEDTLVVPNRSPVEVPGAREAFDLIGFTYRHAVAVRGDGALLPYPQQLPVAADGQVPWVEGLALTIHRLADVVADALPDRPLLLAGFGLTTTDEGRREDYLRDALGVIDDAVAGGIDLRGAWWTPPFGGPGGLFDPDGSPRPAADLLRAHIGSS